MEQPLYLEDDRNRKILHEFANAATIILSAYELVKRSTAWFETFNNSQREAIAYVIRQLQAGQPQDVLPIRERLTWLLGQIKDILEDQKDRIRRSPRSRNLEEHLNLIIFGIEKAVFALAGFKEEPRHVDLAQLVRRVADLVRSGRIRVETPGLARQGPWLRTGRFRLTNVLVNLLNNAADAMPEGGAITVEVSSESGEVTIRVSDTGPGISLDPPQRIFEPGVSTKKSDEGSIRGMGLAIVKQLLEEIDASIRVENRRGGAPENLAAPQGTGVTFTITLPA